MDCPKCGKSAQNKTSRKRPNQWRCKNPSCGINYFSAKPNKSSMRILLFDIETLYKIGAIWRCWKQNILMDQILKEECMLSFSAKWLNDSQIISDVLTPKEARNRNDKRIVKKLWNLFDAADVLIAHNGKKFDIPKCNSYFVLNGLKPPSPFRTVDTREVASKNFAFSHNKLDYLARLFRKERKIETNFDLWKQCDTGNPTYLNKMLKYNEKDVLVLEEIYRELLPWVKSHPNHNLYTDGDVCSNCGSSNIHLKGHYDTVVNQYNSFHCRDCGAFSPNIGKKLRSAAR